MLALGKQCGDGDVSRWVRAGVLGSTVWLPAPPCLPPCLPPWAARGMRSFELLSVAARSPGRERQILEFN